MRTKWMGFPSPRRRRLVRIGAAELSDDVGFPYLVAQGYIARRPNHGYRFQANDGAFVAGLICGGDDLRVNPTY